MSLSSPRITRLLRKGAMWRLCRQLSKLMTPPQKFSSVSTSLAILLIRWLLLMMSWHQDPVETVSESLQVIGICLLVHLGDFDALDYLDDKVFLSRGYDATTHFQTTSADVFDLYKRVSSSEARENSVGS
mmetsp:Transcript_36549/g.146098  ORF Transcript_36549/g.146098 Transcript_36549/m.146098 type:complete len:130 (-) Transcript_36549:629-1018(-)